MMAYSSWTTKEKSSSFTPFTMDAAEKGLPADVRFPISFYPSHSGWGYQLPYPSCYSSPQQFVHTDLCYVPLREPSNTILPHGSSFLHSTALSGVFGYPSEDEKPSQSYIGLIGKAIMSTPQKKLVLSDIYNYIQAHYPYFRNKGPGWRNSIRHNLSLNECFVKVGRSPNGKGHFWAINPSNYDDFSKGEYRRKRASKKRSSSSQSENSTTGCKLRVEKDAKQRENPEELKLVHIKAGNTGLLGIKHDSYPKSLEAKPVKNRGFHIETLLAGIC